MAEPNTLIFVDMPSDDPDAAARFYAKVFGWTDDPKLPGLFHRLAPGGVFRRKDGTKSTVENLQVGAFKAANARPHPDPKGVEPRHVAPAGRRPRVWVLVGEGQCDGLILDEAVKLGGEILWRNHFWSTFNGYCSAFRDPWGNEFVLWSRGGEGAVAPPGFTKE